MGIADYIVEEWKDNKNSVNFKIALGRGEAEWSDRHDYNFKGEPEDESILEAIVNGLIWTAYIVSHPIKFSKAYMYSLKELCEDSDDS